MPVAVLPLTVTVFVGLALGGLLAVHDQFHRRRSLAATLVDNEVVACFFQSLLVLYGITLGLIAVATWESSSEVAGIASDEAASIAALYRDLDGYPQPIGDDLKERIQAYTRFIVDKAWPAQRRGQILDGGTFIINDFLQRLLKFKPAMAGQEIIHAESLSAFNNVIELRRQRLDAVGQGVPAVLWAVVFIGGAISIIFSYCFRVEHLGLHALLTGGLAAMIGLLVFLIASLDHPYRGAVSVSPEPYRLVLERVMALDGAP
jgi:hypothetical protein